jgi:hypothetical protein
MRGLNNPRWGGQKGAYRDEGAWQEDEGEDRDDVHRQRLLLGLDGNLVHLERPLHHFIARRLCH